MQEFEIIFYNKAEGNEPVKDFILGLDIKMRAKVLRSITMLGNNGSELREPYSKPLGDGIFELRIQQGSDITRILCFFIIGNKIILTNGFIKKTKKTPPTEIERAKSYRTDFIKRRMNDDKIQ